MNVDVLGDPYRARVIDCGRDDEGPLVATLVSRPARKPTSRAVLFLHGYVDYFFHTHVADALVDLGFDFYALDLRRSGRSLRPGQTPYYMDSVEEYFEEIDAAVDIIRRVDGHDTLVMLAHSTGGLTAALWAHDRRRDGLLDALVLNSPFLDFAGGPLARATVLPALLLLGRFRPRAHLARRSSGVYGRSLHVSRDGAWDYNLDWKPIGSLPPRAGWVRAARLAQRRVHAGLAIDVPILVACSTGSYLKGVWNERASRNDTVLDTNLIARWAPMLGRHVTVTRVDGGLHDLTLSEVGVRRVLSDRFRRWVEAWVPTGRTADA